MSCKSGARSIDGHQAKVSAGHPAHVYAGFTWYAPGRQSDHSCDLQASRVSEQATDHQGS